MLEVDFIKKEEDLLKFSSRLKRFLTSKEFYVSNLSLITSLIIKNKNKDKLNIPSTILIILSILGYIDTWRWTINTIPSLTKEVKTTYEYQELSKKYNELIVLIAKFIRSFNFKDSLSTSIFLVNLLKTGMFSYDKTIEHTQAPYMIEIMGDLIGSVVCTGKCVCRHESAFVTDVLNKIGYSACNINVAIKEPEEMAKLKSGFDINYNHEIVGVIEDEERYYVDPVHSIFLENYATFKGRNVLKAVGGNLLNIESPYSSIFNDQYEKELTKFYHSEPKEIPEETLEELIHYVTDVYIDNYSKIITFHEELIPLLTEINTLVYTLSPRQETEVTDWVLKKDFTNS